jgi:plastocyanin
MRFNRLVVVTSAVALSACTGGGDKNASSGAADTSKMAAAPSSTATAAPAPGGAAATTTASAVAPAPITGKTVEVKMIGDAKGYRFEPANFTVKVGDGAKFINVTGGPHNVTFNTVPPDSKAQLDANMPAQTGAGPAQKLGELSGPLLTVPNDTYTVSFAGVKPGKYGYNCTPHLALGMKGEITVQ